jgi:hypothetical protein
MGFCPLLANSFLLFAFGIGSRLGRPGTLRFRGCLAGIGTLTHSGCLMHTGTLSTIGCLKADGTLTSHGCLSISGTLALDGCLRRFWHRLSVLGVYVALAR